VEYPAIAFWYIQWVEARLGRRKPFRPVTWHETDPVGPYKAAAQFEIGPWILLKRQKVERKRLKRSVSNYIPPTFFPF
jgi:hypothetical protein